MSNIILPYIPKLYRTYQQQWEVFIKPNKPKTVVTGCLILKKVHIRIHFHIKIHLAQFVKITFTHNDTLVCIPGQSLPWHNLTSFLCWFPIVHYHCQGLTFFFILISYWSLPLSGSDFLFYPDILLVITTVIVWFTFSWWFPIGCIDCIPGQ